MAVLSKGQQFAAPERKKPPCNKHVYWMCMWIGKGKYISLGVSLAGILWFIITYIQCKREEPELEQRFNDDYVSYKKETPMFMPKLSLLIKDIIDRKVHKS